MRRLALPLLVVTLLATSLAKSNAQPAATPQLYLHRAILASGGAAQSSTLRVQALGAAAPGQRAIIQFGGPIAPADRAALERTGVRLLEYLPDFAYLVAGDAAQLAAAARLPGVYARAPLTLADKLAPALLRALARGDRALESVRVFGWPDDPAGPAPSLRTAGLNAAAPLSADDLLRAAALPSVRWIEPVARPRLLNDVARQIMGVNSAWQARGLYGAGQIVGLADSGLDTGDLATISPDFKGRVVATHVLSPGGDLADTSGHGTHIAGSLVGSGVQSGANPAKHRYDGSFAGVAPEASLVLQAFEVDSQDYVVGLDPDYYKLFAQAYADGARLHSDSWGYLTGSGLDPATSYGGYPYGSQRADQFMWEHRDMAIFFAAGNSGKDGTPDGFSGCTGGDGIIDRDSLLMPGTAKNVITVGASENQRVEGGLSSVPWLLLRSCFNQPPIDVDTPSNNPEGMAAFSSRGPTDDGRVKPDIVAPGTDIISNHSHAPGADTLWGDYAANQNYVYSGGTSMSTALVAGAGALVRQWLTTRGIANPSGAAVKAVLLNTTHDMAPGQYGTGARQEIPYARPNVVAGWGRADLGFLDAAQPYALWVDDHTQGIATNQTVSYSHTAAQPLEVLDSSQPLRVMLTWTDPPASLSASKQLVNDLDLKLIGPGGATYYGNNIAGGDRVNNVEGIVIDKPPAGRYTIQVRGYNVPIQSQPYALAVAGALSGGNTTQLMLANSASPAREVAPGGLITYTLALDANRAIAQPVTITDTVPLSTTFVRASNGGTRAGTTVKWTIPALGADTVISRTLVVRVDPSAPDGTEIVNAGYRAWNGVDLPASGPPVTLEVRRLASLDGRRVLVPLVAR